MPERRSDTLAGQRRSSTTDAPVSRYEACLFGPFQILRNGDPVTDPALRRASARTLLKWFLLNPGVRVRSAELCRLLWPGSGAAHRHNKLHVTLHHLRHLLEPQLAARQPSTFIHSDGAGQYWFDFSGLWSTDVLDVDRLFAAAKAAEAKGNTQSAITCYERLLDYYSRTFLPENLFDEIFDSLRAVHDVAHHRVQSQLLRLYLTRGLHHKAISCALSILDQEPYSEEAATAIAEVNLSQGNVLSARNQLAGYLQTVHRELEVSPSPAIVQLWERVRRSR